MVRIRLMCLDSGDNLLSKKAKASTRRVMRVAHVGIIGGADVTRNHHCNQ